MAPPRSRPPLALRRSLLAVVVTALAAAVLRLGRQAGVPPQGGGWRELSGPEMR